MTNKTSPLRLGALVRFKDRWAGKLVAIEVVEDWEVINVTIQHGFLRPRPVRLPLEAATAWGDSFLAFDHATSLAAFGREIPPVAARAYAITGDTQVAGGGRVLGFLVEPAKGRAQEVLLERGGKAYRVPCTGASFEGKLLHPGVQPEAFLPYYEEQELRERVRKALAAARGLTSGELHHIDVHATETGVALAGNVRTGNSREAARRAVAAALGLPVDVSGLHDDAQLETEIGLALDRASLTHRAEIFARCTLGDALLLGRGPTQAVADEAARLIAALPGVRAIRNRIEVAGGSGAEPTRMAA